MAVATITDITGRAKGESRGLTAGQAAKMAARAGDEDAARLLRSIDACKSAKQGEMRRLADLCDRYDNLYYPNAMTQWGADHFPEDPNLGRQGANHLSLNVPPVYVDVPAALLSVTPIENMLAADPAEEGAKDLAAAVERMYFAWKRDERFEIKCHRAAITNALYGRTAVKVYWDAEKEYPCVSVIDQPRNLWLGWSDTDYTRLDWAIYVYKMTPAGILAEFGLETTRRQDRDDMGEYPFVGVPTMLDTGSSTYMRTQRDWSAQHDMGMIEVHDFWYRKPTKAPKEGVRTPMETWNAILVGNYLLRDESYPEYDGMLPFLPVFNTYIPGVADGRSNLYDVEMLIREKEQRLAAGGTMIGKAVGGQFWQLTGQDAPDRVPSHIKPKPDIVVAPGAGNRIESIEPWVPEFQLEQYLDRLDRELADVSGLNDLLRGLAPAAVLSSGKAINALVANYEARISLRRDMFYLWRTEVWDMVKRVWGNKVGDLKPIFESAGRLSVRNPSLTPRDDIEVATMSANLLAAKIWSLSRAMDATGVEDPEDEKDLIREERTDASLFAADVQTQAALLATFQQMGMQQQQMGQMAPGGPAETPEAMGDAAMAARMAQNGGRMGEPMLNGAGEGVLNPEAPGNMSPQDQALAALMAGGIQTGPGFNAVSQTQIKGGEPSNRLLLQQPLAPGSEV